MNLSKPLPRRTLLRSAGVAMGLPLLEAMQTKGLAANSKCPTRYEFFYIPNGVVKEYWYPQTTGKRYEMPTSLSSFNDLRDDVSIITGMDRIFATGTGVHAQAGACWLTSSAPDKPLAGGLPTNISRDRILAQKLGKQTTLPSLELSCNNHTNNKETRYFESISWYDPGYAANVEKNPRNVFGRIFGSPTGNPSFRSVLHVIHNDAKLLQVRLGSRDSQKIEEYWDSIRATEVRIHNAEIAQSRITQPPIVKPTGIPDHSERYIQLMGELLLHAFRLDLTRVGTFVIDPERWDTPRVYQDVFDKPQNNHVLTHSKGEEAKASIRKIDRFHADQFAKILKVFKDTQEGEGSLLDNCLFTLGSGMGDGRVHDYGDLPIILAGNSNGRIQHTGHLRPVNKPIANLWLQVLQLEEPKAKRFADSTGSFGGILS